MPVGPSKEITWDPTRIRRVGVGDRILVPLIWRVAENQFPTELQGE